MMMIRGKSTINILGMILCNIDGTYCKNQGTLIIDPNNNRMWGEVSNRVKGL